MPTIFKFRTILSLIMSLLMAHIPEMASAEIAPKMISTQEFVEQMSRQQAEAKVIAQLDREEVQVELKKYGVSAADAKMRLASLSDSEVRQLATEMEGAQYGGVLGILLVVVLVLLIIYLARRI